MIAPTIVLLIGLALLMPVGWMHVFICHRPQGSRFHHWWGVAVWTVAGIAAIVGAAGQLAAELHG